MSHQKVIVEVFDAHDLIARTTSNLYVHLNFYGQKLRTKAISKDSGPQWNEKMEFSVNDPTAMAAETLEIDVYNEMADAAKRGRFLGRLRISGSSIVKQGQESLVYYPLEKRSIFWRVKGELGLKVYLVDEEEAKAAPNPEMIQSQEVPMSNSDSPPEDKEEEKPVEQKKDEKHVEENKEEKPVEVEKEEKSVETEEQVHKDVPEQEKSSSAEEIQSEAENVGDHSVPSIPNEVPSPAPARYSNFNDPGEKISGTYDLVQQMQYLFVRVIKASDLNASSSDCLYVKITVGDHSVRTRDVILNNNYFNPEWNEVFAISVESLNTPTLEIQLKRRDSAEAGDEIFGVISLELQEIPTRVHPDSPLAPQWYKLEDAQGRVKVNGDIMLSVWLGTQTDEAFQEAWQSYSGGFLRSKVYLSPKLWYLRVNVIEAWELRVSEMGCYPEFFVKAQLGFQIRTTRISMSQSLWNPFWNQDLVFVAAEPFEDVLSLSVENRGPKGPETVGRAKVSLNSIEKRLDHRLVSPRWLELGNDKMEFKGRLHLRLCFDGGYHVLDEATHMTSDLRPTCKELWHPCVGVLEVGILGAKNLFPTKTKDGKGTIDPFCVAKYGRKWIRTRTIVDNLNPKWNEQYTWEVYDPCTVFTLGVFDNELVGPTIPVSENRGTARMGKVRIRVSTLEIDRVYTNSYPLLVLRPNGLQKMGEVQLAVRFSCSSLLNTLHLYSTPLLPKMHYLYPLGIAQQDALRHSAMKIVALRLSRSEPPLKEDLVHHMLDTGSSLWSMRRSRVHWFRMVNVLSTLIKATKWVNNLCQWKSPLKTVVVQVLLLILVCYPEFILPLFFMYMFFIGLCHYRYRFKHQQSSSHPIEAHPSIINLDELEEEFEFDTLSCSVSGEALKMRYDRLRSLASRVQIVLGDVASQGERLQALLSWRDPRATAIFVLFCLIVAVVLFVTPFQVIAVILILYFFRHPKLRHPLPSASLCFFRRLPALSDLIL